jgi:hypothetical protein
MTIKLGRIWRFGKVNGNNTARILPFIRLNTEGVRYHDVTQTQKKAPRTKCVRLHQKNRSKTQNDIFIGV